MAIYQNLTGTTSSSFRIGKASNENSILFSNNNGVLEINKSLQIPSLTIGNNEITAEGFKGTADSAINAQYATFIGDSNSNYDFITLKNTFDTLENKFNNALKQLKISIGSNETYQIENNIFNIPAYTEGATKVESSNINGNIKINGVETKVYSLSVDNEVSESTETSTNPVTTKAVYSALHGDQSFNNVDIRGSLTVTGTITSNEIINTSISDKLFELYKRDDATSLSGYSGFFVNNYDADGNAGALVFDNTGTAYVGDVTVEEGDITNSDNLQQIATRIKDIESGNLAIWEGNGSSAKLSQISKDELYKVKQNNITFGRFYLRLYYF